METLTGSLVPVTADRGLLLLLVLPLLGAIFNGLFGRLLQRRLGERAVHVVAIAVMGLATIVAVAAVLRLAALPAEARFLLDRRFTMVAIDLLRVDFALALDPLSGLMILIITIIGTLIHVYAAGYMAGDAGAWRFFAALNLFVFSMLLLVLGDSLLLCFFGWEGVGLCSYLLIGFWYEERANAEAARKAFVVNRVGDWGFLAGLLLLFAGLGGRFSPAGDFPTGQVAAVASRGAVEQVRLGPTLTFRDLGAQLSLETADGVGLVRERLGNGRLWGLPLPLLIGLCFFLGMSGKSAQIPLHVWLPDAMAGPTPVSALIHAATMVTAGVYLAARLAFLFALSPHAMAVIAAVGLLTALFGALVALVQQDVKKVLAYSTISQLGFMFLAVGVGAHGAALFHLVTHACFKACLFLAAGALIHALHETLDEHEHGNPPDPRLRADPRDPQDLRNMGGLARALPRTRLAYLLGALAIAGFPIAAGFYSKDEILAAVLASGLPLPTRLFFSVALGTSGLTSFYVFRSYYLAFFARPARLPDAVEASNGPAPAAPHEAPRSMRGPLLVLAGASVIVGPLLGWPEAWGGHPALAAWLDPVLAAARTRVVFDELARSSTVTLQIAGVLVALFGWAAARALYRDLDRTGVRLAAWRERYDLVHRALWQRLHVDDLYQWLVVTPVKDFARAAAWFDRACVDGLVLAVARVVPALALVVGWMDRTIVDGLVGGVSHVTLAAGRRLQRVQTGRLNHYVLGIAVGAALLVVAAWALK